MDRRRLKKVLLYEMLSAYDSVYFANMGEESQIETIALVYDLVDDIQPSKAQIKRFMDLMQEMVENAMDKLD
tara:strand:+ start:707 stop:922 length:216 start_codon:yes stop_codon:yes gene_type:complete